MPQRPRARCSEPRCGRRAIRGGRCDEHARSYDRRTHDLPWRDYGRRWEQVRRVVLAEEPTCRRCGAPSEEVDHILPRRRALQLGFPPERRDNLQALCRRHHSAKTAGEVLNVQEVSTDHV